MATLVAFGTAIMTCQGSHHEEHGNLANSRSNTLNQFSFAGLHSGCYLQELLAHSWWVQTSLVYVLD